MRTVVIAIATFKRPARLTCCLEAVARLHHPVPVSRLAVIVVDNDPAGSAAPAVSAARERLQLDIRYAVERRPGISAARNCCVRLATDFSLLAFLDDDEWPDEEWLTSLIDTLDTHNAAIVGGPVVPRCEQTPPRWYRDGRFDEPIDRPTGLTDKHLPTGNLLIDLAATVDLLPYFRDEYGTSGGEDTDFWLRAKEADHRLAWCAEAIVYEAVPAERMRLSWVLRRQLRTGNTQARLMIAHGTWPRRKAAGGGAHVAVNGVLGLLRAAPSRDTAAMAVSLSKAATGVGRAMAALGYVHNEYRRRR